jgi:hypothetical protein
MNGCTRPASPSSGAAAVSSAPPRSLPVAPTPTSEPGSEPAAPARESTVSLALNAPWTEPRTGARFELQSLVVEQIEASPENPAAYPAGAGVVMTLVAAGSEVELSELPAAYAPKRVAWVEGWRIQLLSFDDRPPTVDIALERITDEVVVGSERTVEVRKGEELALSDELTMRFDGHGHKRVMAGQRSPLVVHVTYVEAGTTQQASYNLLTPPDDRAWRWQDHELRLVDHAYDERMTLSVRRLRLAPVPPAARAHVTDTPGL